MRPESRRRIRRAAVTALPALAILIGLGIWQLERRDWKHALIAHMDAGLAAPPVQRVDAATPPFHRAALRGSYLNDKEMRLDDWPRDGRVGAEIVTPFRTDDGTVVIVDRGWVPMDRRDPASRPQGQITGETLAEGVLRPPVEPNMFAAPNKPAAGEWHHVDPAAMARAAGLDPERTARLYLVAGPGSAPGGWPMGRPLRVELPDNHLQYALTWFSLALVLVIVFGAYVRRTLLEDRG